MVELNWLLFCFLFLYLGQSAFSIWLDRINLIHAEKHADKAPAGFEGFIDESKLTRRRGLCAGKNPDRDS